ncbi:MAG: sulfotransferase family protein [Desulfococcaceae bacterium]
MFWINSIRHKGSNALIRYPRAQYPLAYICSKWALFKGLFSRQVVGHDEPKFLFIVSCGRSGTTLLRRLLVENYAIYIPPETYILSRLVSTFLRMSSLSWEEKVSLAISSFQYHHEFYTFGPIDLKLVHNRAISVSHHERSLGIIVRIFFEELAKLNQIDCEWFGDKTPMYFGSLGLIQSIFPSAKFVHIVRDPADVISSIVSMGQHGDAESAAFRWRKSINAWHAFKKSLPAGRSLEITYEKLVTDTESTLEIIQKVFGLPKRKAMISVGHSLQDVHAHEHLKNVLKPVKPDNIGKGRAKLSNEERAQIRPITNKLAQHYGYEPI